MISKLPRWVEYGAFILAFIAGSINAIGLLGLEHQAISHLSGTATLLGTGLLGGNYSVALHLASILFCFFLGAGLSGFLLQGRALKLGRHYDTALFVEALLIFASIYLLKDGLSSGHLFASAACGLQNALATTYSGAVVRTTHVTGIVTDLGIMFGEAIKGQKFDRRKGILFGLIIIGFVSGGALGAYLFAHFSFFALGAPGGMCFCLAVLYRLYRNRVRKNLKTR